MIYSYTTKEQTINTDDILAFNIDAIKTGNTVIHEPGTGIFEFDRAGFYCVNVTAVATATAETASTITIQLYNGTTPYIAAIASETSTSTTDLVDLCIDAIIPVRPSCCAVDNTVYLSVNNVGDDAVFTNVTITIKKIA